MSFKIKSTVSVFEYPPEGIKAKGINHVVLSRERFLHPGEKISVSGSVTHDVETRGGWINAKGEIRIIDGNSVGIRWKPRLGETLFHAAIGGLETSGIRSTISEAREYTKWEEERRMQIKEGGILPELGDAYHSEPILPEIFTLADKARLGLLTEKTLQRVEGMKRVDRRTELVYEP